MILRHAVNRSLGARLRHSCRRRAQTHQHYVAIWFSGSPIHLYWHFIDGKTPASRFCTIGTINFSLQLWKLQWKSKARSETRSTVIPYCCT